MNPTNKYNIDESIRFVQEHFGVDPKRGIRLAGLPSDFMTLGARPISAEEYYTLWEVMEEELPGPQFPREMAQKVVEIGFDSSVHAFYSSPTVLVGLQRKALLKPLLMPLQMVVSEYDKHVVASFGTALPGRPLPRLMGWFNLFYFVMAIRHATGRAVSPVAVEAERTLPGWDANDPFFGGPVLDGTGYRLVLTAEDANLPLVTRNDLLWEQIKRDLEARFETNIRSRSTAARVRHALVEGLPGGQVTADQIARSLALSKRSLQRRLAEEGFSFKDMLEDTRRAMALNYLSNTEMSVQEIAYLLGFRDPSSFFRAFRSWTGSTPQAIRNEGMKRAG